MKKTLSFFILATTCLTAGAQQAELLKDINPGTASSYIIYMTTLQNKVIFQATNKGNTNSEPWVTDGTSQGTFMLKEINPDPNLRSNIGQMIVYNNEVYFSADDGTHGTELWKTDGTTDGTKMVKDIAPGSVYGHPGDFAVFKGALYFHATHPDTGSELWKSDGTTDGTIMVKDLSEGTTSTLPGCLFATSSMLYFFGLNDHKLYGSDGTVNGTKLISDKVKVGQLDNAFFAEYKNEVYFRAVDATSVTGSQLWKTSGNSVTRVTGFLSGTTQFDPSHLTLAGGKLFMVGEQEPYGRELWVLDDSGIHMVKDINPDGHGGLAGAFFTEFKGKLVFSANPPSSGQEVWVSDGTEAGTKIIKDLNPGPASSFAISPVNIGDTLYYSADDGTGGELWRLISPDGQPEKFTNITGGGAWGPELARIGKTFVFSAGDATSGTELWKMMVSGSTSAKDICPEDPQTLLYPNPVNDYFIVEIPDLFSLPAVISLYNISGERIMETEATNYSMTFNACKLRLSSGLYFMRVEDGTKHQTIKFLVI